LASLLSDLQKFFEERAAELGVRMAFLYGSRARGIPREGSDLDIAVVFDPGVSEADEVFRRSTSISLALGDIVGLEVNVLAITLDSPKPMLYHNAIVMGTPVFMKDLGDYVNLRHEVMSQMEDFQLFGVRWQLEAARRNLSHG
jgi:predicted nucleotidyltransferase